MPEKPKEKPTIEQILDIMLQRGQITPEEHRTLQEQVKQEQAAAAKEPSATVARRVGPQVCIPPLPHSWGQPRPGIDGDCQAWSRVNGLSCKASRIGNNGSMRLI